MEVILLERVAKLGNLGETVDVKPGFARNFLLPQGKALRANERNMAVFEARRAELEKRNEETRQKSASAGEKLAGGIFEIYRSASESDSLYGSVTARDIADVINDSGDHKVHRNMVNLDQPFKTLGIYDISVELHPEVIVDIKVNVARNEEEAKLQADGKSIRGMADDAEAEAEAELAAMLDEVGSASGDDEDDDN